MILPISLYLAHKVRSVNAIIPGAIFTKAKKDGIDCHPIDSNEAMSREVREKRRHKNRSPWMGDVHSVFTSGFSLKLHLCTNDSLSVFYGHTCMILSDMKKVPMTTVILPRKSTKVPTELMAATRNAFADYSSRILETLFLIFSPKSEKLS